MPVLRAGEDYEVDRSRLPEGYVMLDEVRIAFPGARTGASKRRPSDEPA